MVERGTVINHLMRTGRKAFIGLVLVQLFFSYCRSSDYRVRYFESPRLSELKEEVAQVDADLSLLQMKTRKWQDGWLTWFKKCDIKITKDKIDVSRLIIEPVPGFLNMISEKRALTGGTWLRQNLSERCMEQRLAVSLF